MTQAIQIHLLYASVVWLAAWLLTSLQRGSATMKYWIWVATALNFMLPLRVLPIRIWPARLSWFTPRIAFPSLTVNAKWIAVIWAIGAAAMLVRLIVRIRAGRDVDETPAVIGFLRPSIFLPRGIERLLNARELHAVLTHEMRHARRRDNLIRLLYEVSLCAFWFHPLVWMTGRRLALYRELSCDEAVRDGDDLVSALAKLANPQSPLALQATASSFIADRIERLTTEHPRAYRVANAILAAAFIVVLLGAIVGPIAEAAANYACALTHGTVR